jgi:hypothetical protein
LYNILVGKPKGKRLIGILGLAWERNIRMDLREIGWTGFIWIRIETNGWPL